MNSYMFLFILLFLWIETSTSNTDKNLLRIQTLGVDFKSNTFIFNDRKSFKHAMVNNKFFSLDSTREESVSRSTHYNESIILNFLCYGMNFTERHVLTWHHVIGDTEIETASLDTMEPNNNYTLSLTTGTFDNESILFCTASVPFTGDIVNRTNDIKLQMNDVLNEDFAIITACNGNYSVGSTRPCKIGGYYNTDGIKVSKRRKREYLTAYGYIEPAYYNEYFPTVIHKCSTADKSILKAPDGTAQVNVNETFTFDKSDNGTVIYCSRFVNILKDLKLNESKVRRETYNERIYIYNEFYWKDYDYSVNFLIIIFVVGIVVIVIANILGAVFGIRNWLKKRRNPVEESTKTVEEKHSIRKQLQELCKWKKIIDDK